MTASLFWTIATIMSALTTAVFVVPLFWFAQAPSPQALKRRQLGAALVGAASVPLVALGLYRVLGAPQLIAAPARAMQAALPSGHVSLDSPDAPTQGGDLAAAVARLEARLEQSPNDPEGWRLLSQAYAFAGRAEEAAQAATRAASIGAPPASDAAESNATAPRAANVQALIATAQEARRQRDFSRATRAFEQLAQLQKLDADLWADYADAQAALTGGFDSQSAKFIDQALRLEPTHTKALWLQGSLQVQRKDYRAALTTWRQLARQFGPGSSDHNIISANIAEAEAALGATPVPPGAMQSAAIVLRGSVVVDPKLLAKIGANSVLFVYAKAVDSPGPPLAVLRLRAGRGTTEFRLDDSSAMLPERRLSKFNKVVVEARISESGDAMARPGDLRGTTVALDPRTAGPVRLVINEAIG